MPRGAARDQKIADVDAGDQQNDSDYRHQDCGNGRGIVAAICVREAADLLDDDARWFGIVRELGRDGVDLGCGLARRDAGFQAAKDEDRRLAAIVHTRFDAGMLLHPVAQRHPQIHAQREVNPLELFGRDADDGVPLRFRSHALADDVGIAREEALPGSVADDAGFLVFTLKPAAEEGADADDLRVIERDGFGAGVVGEAIEIETGFSGVGGGHAFKRRGAVAEVAEIGIGEKRAARTAEDD
jgi:hypothetical protein